MRVVQFMLISSAAGAINCRGSAVCATDKAASVETIRDQVQALISQGGGDRIFGEREPIACSQGDGASFCAFFDHTSGTPNEAAGLLQQLINRGCRRCGSVPSKPGHSVTDGAMTVNFVKEPCCKGNCFC